MQFMVEIGSDADGRVVGEVTAEGGRPAAFTGWMELLRVLELGAQSSHGGVDPLPETGEPTGET